MKFRLLVLGQGTDFPANEFDMRHPFQYPVESGFGRPMINRSAFNDPNSADDSQSEMASPQWNDRDASRELEMQHTSQNGDASGFDLPMINRSSFRHTLHSQGRDSVEAISTRSEAFDCLSFREISLFRYPFRGYITRFAHLESTPPQVGGNLTQLEPDTETLPKFEPADAPEPEMEPEVQSSFQSRLLPAHAAQPELEPQAESSFQSRLQPDEEISSSWAPWQGQGSCSSPPSELSPPHCRRPHGSFAQRMLDLPPVETGTGSAAADVQQPERKPQLE
eukprot:gnl/TRDRNA2_/TRDRNA2_174095_c0_seq2.p1 gnl/TRDRNA2_/TRDRNA2_174095_c0~~gnl/TRDRNA2_/TRDRNA2_174095_c0_seq2.p1  ORF type:complete len:279 (-),score=32.50 gnl/TRDRNA2_/TRDRNA2_174095_c0_seq2:161-997(-)